MNRNIIYVLILIIGLILQVTLFSLYTPWGIEPDFMLVLIIVISILEGPKTGLLMGIIGGLLQDIFLGNFISINTLIKGPLAFVSGLLEGKFYKGNYFLAPVATFFASIIYYLLAIILSEELIFSIKYWHTIRSIILPSALYNGFLAFIAYIIFYKIFYGGENYYGR
ncbi:MAG: rod shape-determining protein MreD [Halanaerobiales bacterium]